MSLRTFFDRLFRKRKLETEMAEELRQHIELRTQANVAAGMSPHEAWFAAKRQFGGAEQIKEIARDQRGLLWLENLFRDIRYGARSLRKDLGFTVVVVLTLALGIGASTAIFSSANSVLFRPMPYPEPDRLVVVTETHRHGESSGSPGNYYEWRKQTSVFENLATSFQGSSSLMGMGEPQSIQIEMVTANYFSTLGVRPMIGRDFCEGEDTKGNNQVAILSYGYWMRQFGGRADVLDRTVQLNEQPVTIIGVMSESFHPLFNGVGMWIPAPFRSEDRQRHSNHFLDLFIGRLKPGITIQQARNEMAVVTERLAQQFPETNAGWGVIVRSLLEAYVGSARPLMLALLGAVGFLLLISCTNIANLMLARALARRREYVIRAALGASRNRIIHEFLAESLLLALLGGGLGFLIAHGCVDLLVAFAPATPRLNEITLDGRALGFAAVLTLLTGLGVGFVPAFHATRLDLNDALKSSGRSSTSSGKRLRGLLVIFEFGLALILLIGAGLLVRSMVRLQQVDPGFQPQNAFRIRLNLPRRKYSTAAQFNAFADQVVSRLSQIPRVRFASVAQWLPLATDGSYTVPFAVAGRTNALEENADDNIAAYFTAGPEFGRAMGIPLLHGRFFTEHDNSSSPPVVVINDAMARKYFGEVNPIGQHVTVGGPIPSEVIGVVGNLKAYDLREGAERLAQIYAPLGQHPTATLSFVISADGPFADLPVELREAVRAVDPDQPILSIDPLDGMVAQLFSSLNFSVFLFSVFSGTALVLAAIGIYGVMAYFVTQHNGEIGIRIALGAQRTDVLRLILLEAGQLVGLGLAVGLIGALGLTHFLQSMLFGVGARDPFTLVAIALLLALIAIVACLLPALRATRINPVNAMRNE